MRVLLASLLCATAMVGCADTDAITTGAIAPDAGSMVRVDLMGGGHGSGVYIGNGIVITAGHVGKDQKVVTLKLDNDTVQSAEVLWVNTEYDVAALRPVRGGDMRAAHLDCRVPHVGEAIIASGNPGSEDDLSIPGVIVGHERKSEPWESVVLATLNMTGGVSGGPVYNALRKGNDIVAGDSVLGIVVGGQIGVVRHDENGYDLSQTGIAYIVPGSAICGLLGRESATVTK